MRTITTLHLEGLEDRLSMDAGISAVLTAGMLAVTGTDGDDSISIARYGNLLYVAQADAWFDTRKVNSIEVDFGDGHDTLRIIAPGKSLKAFDEATTIEAGDGNDVFLGPGNQKLYFGGDDGELAFTRKGVLTIDGDAPDWFNKNISSTLVRDTAQALAIDGLLSRADMLDLFADLTPSATLGKANFDSLKALVANKTFFVGLDYVQALSSYIVDGCVANKQYQNSALGNLKADSTGNQLQLLVNKWFLGLDHPNPADPYFNGQLTYLSVSGDLFDGSPNYTQIHQGNDGDCYFLSGMTAITVQNPNVIEDMFIVNGDNTWTVRFYHNGKPIYVTIDDMLPVKPNGEFPYSDYAQRYDDPSNILWAPFAEKAYCQFAEFGYLNTDGPKNNSYDAINGGYPTEVFNQIIGTKGSSMMNFKKGPNAIINAFDAGRPVTFATLDPPPDSQIVPGHIYAMLDYDAAHQKFVLFNPWGLHNGSQYPGIMHMTFEEVTTNYGYWGSGAVL